MQDATAQLHLRRDSQTDMQGHKRIRLDVPGAQVPVGLTKPGTHA